MKPTAALLAQLEPLPYPERMAALARWARGSADVPRVVAELGAGSAYDRFLAVTAAVISGGDVTPFRHDPDASVRAVAVKHLLRSGRLAGDELAALVADAPAELRALVYRTLRWAGPATAADGLIDTVLERYGDQEAARLLPACGPETVRRLLPSLDHAVTLSLLARRHAGMLLDHAESLLAAAGAEQRDRHWAFFGSAGPGEPAGSGSSTCWSGTPRPAHCPARSVPTAGWPGPRRPGSPPCSAPRNGPPG